MSKGWTQSNVHRGREKAGKTGVTSRLSPDELIALDRLATRECRTRAGQVTWILLQALKEDGHA